MKLVDLTILILELNAAIDHGDVADWAETKRHIERGDIFDWLRSQKFSLDLSFHTGERAAIGQEIVSEFQQIHGGYAGQERRKWGVENNGLNLLLAWTNEIIQQKFR